MVYGGDRYVWFKNPKAASSTLTNTLQAMETRDSLFIRTAMHPEVESSIHVKPYQIPAAKLEKMLVGREFVRFAFVRNPFSRLVSGYLDKVMNNKPEKRQILNRFCQLDVAEANLIG
jgi:hypothetical protein